MSITRKIKGALAAVLCAGMLAGCAAGSGESSSESSSQNVSENSSDNSAADSSGGAASTEAPEAAPTEEPEAASPDVIHVAALKGPTAMGMIKLMDDNSENSGFEFTVAGAADEITPSIIQGKIDVACVPANLASVLYNKTEGGVKVLAVNTLGVLYIVQNGEPTITSAADLAGKTIYASGKGATPEFALRYILTQNGLDPDNDVSIEWKSGEHSECLSALLNDEGSAALLPQPFVTTAQTKNESVSVALDLNKEWEEFNNGSALITGVVIARSEFAEQYPEAVASFMEEYKASVEYVNSDNAGAAQLIGKYDIVPAAVAEKALPHCNIVFISGAEMKEKLSGYLEVLYESDAASVGGAVPADDFYYGA